MAKLANQRKRAEALPAAAAGAVAGAIADAAERFGREYGSIFHPSAGSASSLCGDIAADPVSDLGHDTVTVIDKAPSSASDI